MGILHRYSSESDLRAVVKEFEFNLFNITGLIPRIDYRGWAAAVMAHVTSDDIL